MPRAFTVNDKYFYKAKKEGYAARSVFKLEEIQNKFHIIKFSDKVLDLGCAPGSWLQFLSKTIGPKGFCVGIDLQKVDNLKLANVKTFECDIYDDEKIEEILSETRQFNLISSDMAPNTSGVHDVDCARSEELCERVIELCKIYLKSNGNLVMKIFQGEDFPKILNETRKIFKKVSCFKPKACRDRSRETYIIGMRKV